MDKVNTPRMRSLLAYLVLHSFSLTRQQIAFSFWPDSSEKQARTNLRQLLHNLHRAFPQIDNFLMSDNKTLRWIEDSDYVLDVAEFEKFVKEANEVEKPNEPAAQAQAFISAVDCYKGDLLPECYEEWIEPERERLHNQFITVLQRLVQVLENQREYKKAIGYARKLVRIDDLNEFYYISLMRLHMLNTEHTAALKVYHSCAEILERELEVQPGAEIQKLFRKIKNMSEHNVLPGGSPSSRQPERTPLVGRHREWETLQKIWQSVNDGSPQMVWISGEAGIGKTHLAEELLEWVNRQGGTTASARFYAIERSLAFAPVAEWLRLDRFRTSLAVLDDVWLKEIARILPELQIERKELEPPAPLAENWQRQRFFEAMARAVLAAGPPILLFIDDLQWCDLETLGWLHYLLRFNSKAQLLIVCTVRPEELTDNKSLLSFMLDLRREGFLSQIEIAPLDADNSFLLANKISSKELAADWTDWLFKETEGNPLFVVEMTRAGLDKEQGAEMHQVKNPVEIHLPLRMQAVIYSRLVQLSPSARKLVDLAATIGRDFSIEVITHACEQDEENLVEALDELLRRGIIREQGNMAYYFSHKKISDVAYSSISEGQRRLLHRRVAGAIETVYAENRETVSSQLALHFEKANETEKAIGYYQMAGEASRLVYANGEAIEYLSEGLALVHRLSVPGAEREKMELSLLLQLAPCLVQ
ncbi:MAG: AAA family ATPase [Calditrichia bacterium]